MEPIISPWLIYIINLSHYTKGLAAILAVVFGFLFLGLFLVYKTASREELTEGEARNLNMVGGYSKIAGILLIVFATVGLVLPARDAGIQMLILSYSSEKNVKALIELTGLLGRVGKEDIDKTLKQLKQGDASETN